MSAIVSSIDVAKYAGVSQTTVSRVLNTPHLVKQPTFNKVMRAIEELNYIPNANARSLVKKKTGTIALISGPLSNHFFVDTTTSIVNYVTNLGYKINVHFSDIGNLEETYSAVFENRVDGIILSSILIEDPIYEKILKSGIPFILFNRKHESNQNFVEMDNDQAGFLATSYLLDSGHRNIAWVGGPSTMSTFKGRYNGFINALTRNSIKISKESIFFENNTPDELRHTFSKLTKTPNQPSAICAATDALAISLMDYYIGLGYKIPENISIIGIDNVKISKHASINLTTVGINSSLDLGQIAIENLIRKIEENEELNVQITEPVRLFKRKTVKKKE
ncbi:MULTISPECIES: LacI family DNA-binding transcriptional regulator [unclassified Sporosarcina]|uniref:LacI family DNA-binding transcriptional regulator n=1 Tax=unclassified Sporosarcina TaxID=2647733 RepID=UPI00203E1715|nr:MULTISPECIES: LacI family DNA-binding transcriptional regulator [unclassified Sporosarcina]